MLATQGTRGTDTRLSRAECATFLPLSRELFFRLPLPGEPRMRPMPLTALMRLMALMRLTPSKRRLIISR
jgi:hypothetical protein